MMIPPPHRQKTTVIMNSEWLSVSKCRPLSSHLLFPLRATPLKTHGCLGSIKYETNVRRKMLHWVFQSILWPGAVNGSILVPMRGLTSLHCNGPISLHKLLGIHLRDHGFCRFLSWENCDAVLGQAEALSAESIAAVSWAEAGAHTHTHLATNVTTLVQPVSPVAALRSAFLLSCWERTVRLARE